MGKYRVQIGAGFEVDAVEVDHDGILVQAAKVATSIEDSRVRRWLAPTLVILAAVSLVAAWFSGVSDGTFDELNTVWGVVALPVGAIVSRYFGRPTPS